MIKYYFYSNPNQGERYFRVKESEKVLQIIEKTQPKKGRPYQRGVTYIQYLSFLGSWGWRLSESKNIKEITKKEFNKVLDKMIKEFKNQKYCEE